MVSLPLIQIVSFYFIVSRAWAPPLRHWRQRRLAPLPETRHLFTVCVAVSDLLRAPYVPADDV